MTEAATPPARREGRLSKDDIAFIEKHKELLAPKEIADRLGRREVTIQQYLGLNAVPGKQADQDRLQWNAIKEGFSPAERLVFREEYDRFRGENEEGFLPAEQAQLTLAITFGILMTRTLTRQYEIEKDLKRISEYKKQKEEELFGGKGKKIGSKEEFDQLNDFKKDLKDLKVDLQSLVGQLTEFSKERNNILKQLKLTRDQRVQELESGNQNFVSLIKSLNKKENSNKAGRQMELLKLAVGKERERLSKFVEYEDGSEDQPLLNHETVGLYDESRDNQCERTPEQSAGSDDVEQDDPDGVDSVELAEGAGGSE